MTTPLAVIGNKISSREEAIKMANELERLDALMKVMKNQMREYVEKNGPIVTDSVEWNINEGIQYSFSADQLKKIAENLVLEGKNPWELMTITFATLQKCGWSEAAIDNFGEKKITKRFSSRKI